MNYPIRKGIISYLREKDVADLTYALTDIINNAPKRISDAQMNLMGTHDTTRIITALVGESPQGKSNDYLATHKLSSDEYILGIKKVMLAYTILSTIPGIPSIYYGDEVGVQGYSDPFNRLTYPWGNENTSLLKYFIKIGEIRRNNDVYKQGDFELLYLDANLLIFARYNHRHAYFTVVNNSDKEQKIFFSSVAYDLIGEERLREFTFTPFTAKIIKTDINTTLKF